MKKSIITILLIALIGSFAFAAEETARFKLSTTVAEGLGNTGIRVVVGDKWKGQTSISSSEYKTYFINLFNSSSNDAAMDTGDGVTTGDVDGEFSVLVFRGGAKANSEIVVNVSATPMKNEDGSSNYLPYKVTDVKTSTAVVNTLGNPSSSTTGFSYIATTPSGTVGIHDIRVFKYLIPKATNVEYGKYSATVFFSITIP